MVEGAVKSKLLEFLRANLTGYNVTRNGKLEYRVVMKEGKPTILNIRGKGAYEVDILISSKSEKPIPLLAIEVKGGKSTTTHDAIIYSDKARAHKLIYPYLRYGFVSLDKRVQIRTILHSEGFDFIATLSNEEEKKEKRLNELLPIIREEIRIAEDILEFLEENRKSDMWLYPPRAAGKKGLT